MISFVCPKCPVQTRLCAHPLGYGCVSCKTVFPIVDETAIVLKDMDTWFSQQADQLFMRRDLPQEQFAYLLSFPSTIRKGQLLVSQYLQAPHSPLHEWIQKELASMAGDILDVGCGCGLHNRDDVLGIDLNWALLQHFPGKKLVADILDPPLERECADVILAINVLDSITQPYLLLQRLDALLKKGGTLLLAAPFAWADHVTAPQEQISIAWVRGFWKNQGYMMQEGEKEWRLPTGTRSHTVHHCMTWKLTKPQ